MVGLWLCFRLVNMPRFADFLIAVEAEMNKVSWPTRPRVVSQLDGGDCYDRLSWRRCCTWYDLIWRSLLSVLGDCELGD